MHVESEGAEHPWSIYQRVMSEAPEQVNIAAEGRLLRTCHRRVPSTLLGEGVDDISAEVVPSRQLYEAVLERRRVLDGKPSDRVVLSYFRYLTRVRLPLVAQRLQRETQVVLDMSSYASYLAALCVLQVHGKNRSRRLQPSPAASHGRGPAARGADDLSGDLVEAYRAFRDRFYDKTLMLGSSPATTGAAVCLVLLRYSAERKNEVSAFAFFRAFRAAKAVQAQQIGSVGTLSTAAVAARLVFPDWHNGDPRLAVSSFYARPGTNQGHTTRVVPNASVLESVGRDGLFGATSPAVLPVSFVYLAKACASIEHSMLVFWEAVAQESMDRYVAHEVLCQCLREASDESGAPGREPSFDGEPGAAAPEAAAGDALRQGYEFDGHDFGNNPVPEPAAAAGGEQPGGRCPSVLEAARLSFVVSCAKSVADQLPTVAGYTGSCWVVLFEVLAAAGCLTAQQASEALGILSRVANEFRLNASHAVVIAKLLAKHVGKNPSVAFSFEDIIGRDLVAQNSDLLLYLDRMKAGANERGKGNGYGDAPAPRAAEGTRGRTYADARLWEKETSISAAADRVQSHRVTVHNETTWKDVPPWVKHLALLARDFHAKTVVFTYSYAHRLREYESSVIGEHSNRALTQLMLDLGGTPAVKKLIWSAAGDAGVATLIQISRIRLVYALSITILGGFLDVLQEEISNTHALFQEAGQNGAAAEWSWKAMRIYEDEVDDILHDRGMKPNALPLYCRFTTASVPPSQQQKRHGKASQA
eukprot:gene1827-2793_t